MREILFRGRSLETGEWVEGSLVHRTKYYGDPVNNYYILDTGEFDGDYYDSTEVDPKYIHQYTGLNYKDGRKIFEGDLVKDTRTGDYAVVIYYDDHFALEYDDGSYTGLWAKLDSIEHFGIVCEPPEDFIEWSEENEQPD